MRKTKTFFTPLMVDHGELGGVAYCIATVPRVCRTVDPAHTPSRNSMKPQSVCVRVSLPRSTDLGHAESAFISRASGYTLYLRMT